MSVEKALKMVSNTVMAYFKSTVDQVIVVMWNIYQLGDSDFKSIHKPNGQFPSTFLKTIDFVSFNDIPEKIYLNAGIDVRQTYPKVDFLDKLSGLGIGKNSIYPK